MLQQMETLLPPEIVISERDHERLSRLADTFMDQMPDVASELLTEVERARVVAGTPHLSDVVQMESTLEYRADDGQQRRVTLVYPGEADIAEGKISILTPIGTALLGLSTGQSIGWSTRDGRRHQLTVLSVSHSGTSHAGSTVPNV